MRRPSWKNLVLLLVVLLSFSCARLPESRRQAPPGALAIQRLKVEQSVPAEWGQPAAVSESPSGRITRVWYQGEDGTIRMVRYNNVRGRLQLQLWVIPRK